MKNVITAVFCIQWKVFKSLNMSADIPRLSCLFLRGSYNSEVGFKNVFIAHKSTGGPLRTYNICLYYLW